MIKRIAEVAKNPSHSINETGSLDERTVEEAKKRFEDLNREIKTGKVDIETNKANQKAKALDLRSVRYNSEMKKQEMIKKIQDNIKAEQAELEDKKKRNQSEVDLQEKKVQDLENQQRADHKLKRRLTK